MNTSPPTVCAIVPTYNRSGYLQECLDSLLAQTRLPDRILVVNDGSTDDTAAVLQTYAAAHTRLHVINKPNGGKASALNVGLAACTADYVWICDDDDLALPDGLAPLVAALEADATADIAYGHCRYLFEEEGRSVFRPQTYWPRDAEPDAKIRFLEAMFTNQFAMLVRRSLYQKAGPFKEDLIWCEDYEMTLRLTRNAKAVYVPYLIFSYRQHVGLRGTASEKTSGEKRFDRCLHTSQGILRHVRETYALEEFCPTFARSWSDAHARQRATFLQRACALGHNSLWAEAADDIGQAVTLAGQSLPTPDEIGLAEVAIFNDIHWDVLAREPAAQAALRRLHRGSPYGRTLVFALFRRIPRMIARHVCRQKNPRKGIRLLLTMLRVLGVRDTLKRSLRLAADPLPPLQQKCCLNGIV